MADDVSLRVFTGTGAATMSSPQTGIALCDADALSGGDVAPGANSYERWIAFRLDAGSDDITNFSFVMTGDEIPTGVSLLFDVTDTPKTPVNTVSAIAKKTLVQGRRFFFDDSVLDTVGDLTRYLVIQAQVAADAVSGAIPQQTFVLGFQEG